MSKIKVSDLKCFTQVANVIGKAKAQIELFKVLSVSKNCTFTNQPCVREAFSWSDTPQGGLFWTDVDKGINPYDKKEVEE